MGRAVSPSLCQRGLETWRPPRTLEQVRVPGDPSDPLSLPPGVNAPRLLPPPPQLSERPGLQASASPVQPGDLEAPTGDLVQAPLTSGTTWLGDQAPPTPPAEAGPEV